MVDMTRCDRRAHNLETDTMDKLSHSTTRLRALRLNRNLSQERLGAVCGMHQSRISMIEAGRGIPTAKETEALAKALKVKDATPASLIETVTYEIIISTSELGARVPDEVASNWEANSHYLGDKRKV
jgi:transcriptional regulator with XRE-family HTH domain